MNYKQLKMIISISFLVTVLMLCYSCSHDTTGIVNLGKPTPITVNVILSTNTINDTIVLKAIKSSQAKEEDTIVSWEWDLKSDGNYVPGPVNGIMSFVAPDTAGAFNCYVRGYNQHNIPYTYQTTIGVVLDKPYFVFSDNDFQLEIGSTHTQFRVNAKDSLGEIVKYEWDLGNSGSFQITTVPTITIDHNVESLPHQQLSCLVRITDDDGHRIAQRFPVQQNIGFNKIDDSFIGKELTIHNGKVLKAIDSTLWESSDFLQWNPISVPNLGIIDRIVSHDNSVYVTITKDQNKYVYRLDEESEGYAWVLLLFVEDGFSFKTNFDDMISFKNDLIIPLSADIQQLPYVRVVSFLNEDPDTIFFDYVDGFPTGNSFLLSEKGWEILSTSYTSNAYKKKYTTPLILNNQKLILKDSWYHDGMGHAAGWYHTLRMQDSLGDNWDTVLTEHDGYISDAAYLGFDHWFNSDTHLFTINNGQLYFQNSNISSLFTEVNPSIRIEEVLGKFSNKTEFIVFQDAIYIINNGQLWKSADVL